MNVIVDLEHTISNASHRIAMKKNGIEKCKFQLQFKNDRPNENVIKFMEQLNETGSYVIILSAKRECYRTMVTHWLSLHEVKYDELVMMPDESYLTGEQFKEEYVINSDIHFDFALDDVGANCAMFYRNNIPCLRICLLYTSDAADDRTWV